MRDKIFREQRKAFRKERRREFLRRRKRSGSVLAGLLLLCIGTILLLKALGVLFPGWLFTWPMILIAFGLLAGAGNTFRDPGWVIICGVGSVFLLQKIWPGANIYHFIWPILIIALGFIIILAPRRHRLWHARDDERWNKYREMHETQAMQRAGMEEMSDATTPEPEPVITPAADANRKNGDNWLDVVTIFGNVKKLVYSKNFKGGDIVSIFGGTEINLTQADFNGNIVIELVQIFAGAKLIIPPHWQIRSEMVAVFGGIEDKRAPQTNYDTDKVVILRGTTFFGGIEIKSY
jgi:predicted membrane protein